MSSTLFAPLATCLEEFRALVRQKATGTFCLANKQSIAMISIHQGLIEAVACQGQRGDKAVEQIKTMDSARTTFHAEATRAAVKPANLSHDSIYWLAGVVSSAQAAASAAPAAGASAPPPPSPASSHYASDFRRSRDLIESVAVNYLGPIAGAMCASIFSECDSVEQIIDQLAANLPPVEAASFRAEITHALESKDA